MILALLAAFVIGIVNPTPVPAAQSVELGSTMQRYDLVYRGEGSSTKLELAADTVPVLSVYPSNYGIDLLGFCPWVDSILERYPAVQNVIVGNETRQASWPDYIAILQRCAPLIRSHGARVIGPGAHPTSNPAEYEALMNAIGPGLLDVWDQHVYWTDITTIVRMARRTLSLTVWVTEDGAQSRPSAAFASLYYGGADLLWEGGLAEPAQAAALSSQMVESYCAGASVWMNFLLRDEPNLAAWQSGLERPDGSRKPAYTAFAVTAAKIANGAVRCADTPQPPSRAIPSRSARLAALLGETGGWTRDAYEKS